MHDLSCPFPVPPASHDVAVSSLVLEHVADLESFFVAHVVLRKPGDAGGCRFDGVKGEVRLTTRFLNGRLRDVELHYVDGGASATPEPFLPDVVDAIGPASILSSSLQFS